MKKKRPVGINEWIILAALVGTCAWAWLEPGPPPFRKVRQPQHYPANYPQYTSNQGGLMGH